MKIYTEFIVIYPDQPMPAVETFCPSYWTAEDFNANGNYYFEDIDGRWTDLEITRKETGKPESTCSVYTYRENGVIESGLLEVEDLSRYLLYQKQGRYEGEVVGEMKSPVVSALSIDTSSNEDYREFLETVHQFMATTTGHLVNYSELLDATEFKETFLTD